MGSLSLSNLFSSKDSFKTSHVIQTLRFRPSPDRRKATIIEREGPQGGSIPLFILSESTIPNTNVQLSRVTSFDGYNMQQVIIGTAKFHSISGKIDISLHGQEMLVKTSGLSSTYGFIAPNAGKLKWKQDALTGTGLDLVDEAGVKLAKFKPGKRLDLLVPCNDYFLDMIILSGISVARMLGKKETADAIGEVIAAAAGG